MKPCFASSNCFATYHLLLLPGLVKRFRWKFVIASVRQLILDYDFLCHFRLLVIWNFSWTRLPVPSFCSANLSSINDIVSIVFRLAVGPSHYTWFSKGSQVLGALVPTIDDRMR
ncbi:hypothetical protein T4B_3191 [Trichinella pseudospiralis]|uniref:Uncharacterized protein n=1 Tax=Trichinella pseudospiralis TaxID=6337 RepID=A0A0V1IJR0_TRIPS|nr:hypothetical protein T4A_12032 [Trichinella pseudospiralis]KRZ22944.1 hypothetical protein T4B_3191 [Trichinella pseudospiralis]